MAYDPIRRRIVLSLDSGVGNRNQTWIWNGTDWTEAHPDTAPTHRYSPDMAFDGNSQQILEFGGWFYCYFESACDRSDTWLWNGDAWTRVHPADQPVGRSAGGVAYDATRHRVVVFGGDSVIHGRLGDTWLWDGKDWIGPRPAQSPPARGGPGMAWDGAHHQVVLFGGEDQSARSWGDTWIWDGQSWSCMAACS
jgi:hypothetical protein